MPIFRGTPDDDIFTGGNDADIADGFAGNDRLSGADGNDSLAGGVGADRLDGGNGDDVLFAGERSASLYVTYETGVPTPPVMDRGAERDTLLGGAGDDKIFAGYGDTVDGGTSNYAGDKLFISLAGATQGVTADFRQQAVTIGGGTITGIESVSFVEGSSFDDNITLGGQNSGYNDFSVVLAGAGNDRVVADYYTGNLYGESGDDVLDGRSSQYLSKIDGGTGDDVIYGNYGLAALSGGDGNDTIYTGSDSAEGGAGNDLIIVQSTSYSNQFFGDDGDDVIRDASGTTRGTTFFGGEGADTLAGGAGNDILVSGNGFQDPQYYYSRYSIAVEDVGTARDHISGGDGDDRITAGYGDDVAGGSGNDHLWLSLGGAANGVALDLGSVATGGTIIVGGGTIKEIEVFDRLSGSAYADVITTGTQSSLLQIDGGAGDDVVTSADSSILLYGGAGNDRFVTGAASDTFDGGAGTDTVDYRQATRGVTVQLDANGNGTGQGGDQFISVENVVGSSFNDTLSSQVVGSTLSGGGGDDRLQAGAGSDRLFGEDGNDTLNGSGGGDTLSGGAGDDVLNPGRGHSFVDGGTGDDMLVLAGDQRSYTAITAGADAYLLSMDGSSVQVAGVEQVRFANATVSWNAIAGSATPFDGLAYIASYPDLIAALGVDAAAGVAHYVRTGFAAGRHISFDAYGYLAANADLLMAFGHDILAAEGHYIRFGFTEGRTTKGFDAFGYLASNPDLLAAFGTDTQAAIHHYVDFGYGEARSTTTFDAYGYLASNADLLAAFGNDPRRAAEHFVEFGHAENRSTTSFDAAEYVASNADLIRAFGGDTAAATRHYVQFGYGEHRAIASFDGLAYAAASPDLAANIGTDVHTAAQHYILYGLVEGRPTSGFDSVAYLLSNPDLGQAGLDASSDVGHWLTYGAKEGRAGDTLFGREQTGHAIVLNSSAQDVISQARDHDWFAVTLSAGQRIEIDMASSQFRPTVELHDVHGLALASATGQGGGRRDDHLHRGSFGSLLSRGPCRGPGRYGELHGRGRPVGMRPGRRRSHRNWGFNSSGVR